MVNEQVIPSWIDLVKDLHHIEIQDDKSIDIYLTRQSRYSHEWFGDVPILPMHIWKHLGRNFIQPEYESKIGLPYIKNYSLGQPSDVFSGWNGMIGTGPFRWLFAEDMGEKEMDSLSTGGYLKAFSKYHNSANIIQEGLR